MFSRQIFLGMVVLVGLLAGSAPADETGDFRAVTGPCHLRFPEDHGPHPGYRTEWWYYTGHLAADDGRRFGRQLRPADAARDWPDPPSAWRTNQIYLAHAALTDLAGRQHLMAENVRRANLGLAGAVTDGPRTRGRELNGNRVHHSPIGIHGSSPMSVV